jgi:hypothetical protein
MAAFRQSRKRAFGSTTGSGKRTASATGGRQIRADSDELSPISFMVVTNCVAHGRGIIAHHKLGKSVYA